MRTQTYLFVTLLLIATTDGLAQTLPKPTGRVNDFANIISPDVESELDAQLATLENTTSHEVAVVTVESLQGTTVEDYANRLFKEWGIGQAQKDNGVLILVAPNERDVRIEVGYGLEGISRSARPSRTRRPATTRSTRWAACSTTCSCIRR